MQQNIFSNLILLISFILFSCLSAFAQAPVNLPASYGNAVKPNSVRSSNVIAPVTDIGDLLTRPVKDVRHTTQYIDGMGRLLQTVVKQGATATNQPAKDFVSPVVYDAVGRKTYNYLSFASADNTGAFKTDPFQQQAAFYNTQLSGQSAETNVGPNGLNWAYSKTIYEASPLNRVQSTYAPGSSWVGSEGSGNHSISTKYLHNTAMDAVRIWTVTESAGTMGNYTSAGIYTAGELFKNVVTGEQGKQVIEFRDKAGLLILKKVQVGATIDNGTGAGHSDWLCTYYIYDDFNRLRAVIQPAGVESLNSSGWSLTPALLNDQCFRYFYDARGNMTHKQAPGVAIVYMLYDMRDRLVLTQDGNLRNTGKWLFIGYDDLDRQVLTGFYATTQTRDQLATQLASTSGFADGSNIPFDLVLNQPRTNNSPARYVAQNSIAFEEGFASLVNDQFETGFTSATSSVLAGQKAYSFPTFIDMATVDVLTRIYYDNYDWAAQYSSHGANYGTLDNSDVSRFQTASNTSWPYPQALAQSLTTQGKITGSWDKTAGGLAASLIYDEKGRIIQIKQRNHTQGNDVLTTQYSFDGQPLRMLQVQQKAGAHPQTHKILSSFTYDDLERVLSIKKTVTSTIEGVAVSTPEVTIAQYEYDALGRLKIKKLGQKQDANGTYTNDPVETMDHAYNIRSWLLGVNRTEMLTTNGQSSDHYFGYELGYDKPVNTAANNFDETRFNGHIAGILWKSTTDGIRRKYDYHYDAANRLLKGDFEQDDAGNTWGNSQVNYTMQMGDGITATSAYDANGNIKAMKQFGLTASGSQVIDNLTYTYLPGSNKLQKVSDGAASFAGLGDFNDKNTTDDYGYDENGNLVTDKNKNVRGSTGEHLVTGGAITYNHLNLPVQITLKDENDNLTGYISYLYDNSGNKLKKTVEDKTISGKTITTTTTYLGGMVYESKVTVPADPASPDYTDQLQLITHEEGRIRYTPPLGNVAAKYTYDYFIKDYLGNIRMVISSQEQQDIYPIASMENSGSDLSVSKLYYSIDENKLTNRNQINNLPDYPNNNGIATRQEAVSANQNSQVMYRLMATGGKPATGLGITLKVTGGDKVSLFGKSFYNESNTNNDKYPVPVLGLLDGLLGGTATAGKSVTASGLNSIADIGIGVTEFLNNPNRNNLSKTVPRAALNWILFDEQFKVVNNGIGFKKVREAGKVEDLSELNIVMPKSGYLYVYASNESAVPVYFDNIQVVQNRGRVLEETHYYPFGLTMAGISIKSVGGLQNRLKYNGKELQNAEFSDGTGLDLYDYGARMQDPQLGRWFGVDPLTDLSRRWSPYVYAYNNPVNFIDPDGMYAEDWDTWNTGWSSGSNDEREWDLDKDWDEEWDSENSSNMQNDVLSPTQDLNANTESEEEGSTVDDVDTDNGADTDPVPKDKKNEKKSENDPELQEDPNRNPNQDKPLTPGDIEKLKEHGWDHRDKGDHGGQTDLYKDKKGNVYQKPKGGNGFGEPIGVNLNNLATSFKPTRDQVNKVTTAVVVGFVIWEVFKWGVAVATAIPSGGSSLAIAAATP